MLSVLAAAAIAVAAAWTVNTGSAASEQPQTHMGLTAQQWHTKLVRQRHHYQRALNNTADEVRRLRDVVKTRASVAGSHPLERAFLCIHSYEGAWNDAGAPYYGGMQMDMSFQKSYGPEFLRAWGTADNWPISVQLAVSMRAYLSGRGFYPWPNTARYCGLIG